VRGAKQLLEPGPRELLWPMRATPCSPSPAFSVAWVFFHGLGTELGLVVIGLHSAAFAYSGRTTASRRTIWLRSAGFVAFVLVLFATTLHLTMLYAYVIPVGIGVLVLLQLFKERAAPEVRNGVRLVVLLAMIGSAAGRRCSTRKSR